MRHSPSSKVLFVSICSLTKTRGGNDAYDADEAIASELPPRLARKLIWRRERIRQLAAETSDVAWQGVALAELEYNRHLMQGPDFGGDSRARYRPAVERYEGRFFLGMGADRAAAIRASKHHLLLLSGLYGILRPFEPIQLYSCPLASSVAQLWRNDGILTEVLSSYVVERSIERIIDLTAVDAYRRLVDWEEVSGYGAQILHCFHVMGAGDYALIPFGQALRGRLIGMTEGKLLAMDSESRMDGGGARHRVPGRSGSTLGVTGRRGHCRDPLDRVCGRSAGRRQSRIVEKSSGRRLAVCRAVSVPQGGLATAEAVRPRSKRHRGNLQGPDDTTHKHDQAPDRRHGWVLAVQDRRFPARFPT